MNKITDMFKSDFKKPLDVIEKNMVRSAIGILILIIVYAVFSNIIIDRINKKDTEVQAFITDSQQKLSDITNNTKLIQERTNKYDELIQKIEDANNQLTESYKKKNVIPNFLTEIMFNIPKEVQLLSIQNTTGKQIKMEAQSREYEQLGYFIAKIKNENILTDVTATSGTRQGEYILVTIEGNLPY